MYESDSSLCSIEKGDCHILDEFVAAAKEAYLKQLAGVVCVYQAGLSVWFHGVGKVK